MLHPGSRRGYAPASLSRSPPVSPDLLAPLSCQNRPSRCRYSQFDRRVNTKNEGAGANASSVGSERRRRDAASVWLARRHGAGNASPPAHGQAGKGTTSAFEAARGEASSGRCPRLVGQIRRENLVWDVPRIHRDVLEPGVETTQSLAIARTVASALASHRAIYDVVAH